MFGFNHPKPPSRKEVAVQVAEQKQEAVRDLTVIVVATPTPAPVVSGVPPAVPR